MTYYTLEHNRFAGIDNVMISATGYTGSGGFEIYVRNEDVNALWDKVWTESLQHKTNWSRS